jgi:hypothetical protein
MLTEEVGPEEIAAVVSRWTGIPVNRLQQTERQKLLHLKVRGCPAGGCWGLLGACWRCDEILVLLLLCCCYDQHSARLAVRRGLLVHSACLSLLWLTSSSRFSS